MISKATHNTNEQKLSLVHSALREMLDEALCRGYHGVVAIEVTVQDGIIQYVRRRCERVER